MEKLISDFSAPGRIIVSSSGNDALEMGHARLTLKNGNDHRVLWTPCAPHRDDIIKVYGWFNAPVMGSRIIVWVQYHNSGVKTDYFDVTLTSTNNPIFHPRGTASNLGTVTLKNSAGSKRISVGITGRVKVQSLVDHT